MSTTKDTRTKDAESAELGALQAALAAEHAAVYGYGVVGGRIDEARRGEARAAYDAHRRGATNSPAPYGIWAAGRRSPRRRTRCRSP